MHESLGEGGIIAEDLGYLTPEVKAMLSASGYPGMKIMQFAFDSRESGNYLPHTYHRNSVVYTGTHDNVTTEGWRTNASAEDEAYACRYLRCQPEELTEAMICACLASVSDTAVIPLADWLHLGSEARINTPSTQGSNWQWRLTCPLPEALAGHIAQLTVLYERAQ
jgi:4-alpha-glucanotransferase